VDFHGTVNSGRSGWHEAFNVRHPVAGHGAWNTCKTCQPLYLITRATGKSHSFALSLALDPESGAVIAVVFFDHEGLAQWTFESDALLLRGAPQPASTDDLHSRYRS